MENNAIFGLTLNDLLDLNYAMWHIFFKASYFNDDFLLLLEVQLELNFSKKRQLIYKHVVFSCYINCLKLYLKFANFCKIFNLIF